MYQELDNELLNKAHDLVQQGKTESALLAYDEILSHRDQFYSHAVIQKVNLLQNLGDHDQAIAVCDQAITVERYYKFYELKADIQKYTLDKSLEADTNYRQALALLKEEIRDNSTNVYLYIEKGQILKKLNQHLEAIDALNVAEQLTTSVEELGEVYFNKGECYDAWASLINDIEIYEKALEAFEKARRHGKNATHYIEHLTGFIRLNKALQLIEKKISEHPEVAKNYFDKAQILWEMPSGAKQYHEIIHLLDMAESLSKANKEKGEISYLKYVYYKKKKERDAGHSFFDDKDTLSKKIDLLKKAFQYYKQCSRKDNVSYDTAYIAKLIANYYAQLGDETFNLYFYKLALDHFIYAREHSKEPFYGNIFKDSETGIRDMKEKLEGSEYSEDDKSARTVEGVLYQSVEEANEARREIATVNQIKATVDLSDYDSVIQALDEINQLELETKQGKLLLREIQAKIDDLDRKRQAQSNRTPKNTNERTPVVDSEDDDEDFSLPSWLYDDDDEELDYEATSESEGELEIDSESESNPDSEFDSYESLVEQNEQYEQRPNLFDRLEQEASEPEDDYERFVIDENDPRVQEDLIAIAQVLQGDEYKRNEAVAIRCLSQLKMMTFNTPIGAQFTHILERIIADFDLKARTVNGVIFGSRYEAQDLIDQMLDGHDCKTEAEQMEVLRFHEVVERAKRSNQENISLLNIIIPELNKQRFNKELLKPFLISLLDDRGKKELLSKLHAHQERTEMQLSTQIILWVIMLTLCIVLISTFPIVGSIIVAAAYPIYLFLRRGQEYMWKFFTNNGTIPISRYEEYFARPTNRYKRI